MGQKCDNVVFYSDGANNRKYYNAWENDYKKIYDQYHSCPFEYPVCATLKEGTDTIHFCHEECRSNEIFCNTMCINPLESSNFCGARTQGDCTSSDSDSPNFKGYDCHEIGGSGCENGECICLNGKSFKDGECQSDTKNSCGPSKIACSSTQTCDNGQCIDSASCSAPKLNCERCVDPKNDPDYCGSDNCETPIKCADYQTCKDGKCECIPDFEFDPSSNQCLRICSGNEHRYREDCEQDTNEHCGEHGKPCDANQDCVEKQCVQRSTGYEEPPYEEPEPELPPTLPCSKDSDCKENQECQNSNCIDLPSSLACSKDSDCKENEKCQNSFCIEVASEVDPVTPGPCKKKGDKYSEEFKKCCHDGNLNIDITTNDKCGENCSYSDDTIECVLGNIEIDPLIREVTLNGLEFVKGDHCQ